MIAVSTPGNNRMESRRARAGTCGALGLILLLAASEAYTVEAPTAKRVEIRVRALDPALAAQVSYVRQVAPLFANNCADCHSTEDHKGGLDASSVPGLMKGGKKAGPAIVPGKPDESSLVQFLRGLREPQMPKGNPALRHDGDPVPR